MLTSVLANGCTAAACLYVSVRGKAPVPEPTMSSRRPPGFMNAICAPPDSGASVAQRCTSATRLPSVDSPPRFSAPEDSLARLNAPPISPSGSAPSTSASATASDTIDVTAGSAG